MANVTTVVNGGLDLVTALLAASDIKYISWGTDGTEAAVTDTDLGAESAEDRTSGTQTQQTTTTSNDTYQLVGSITATDDRAIVEAGIFDASTAGNLFVHCNFAVQNIPSGDTITFTFKIVSDQG